jgi:hypothetical protein
LRSSNFIDRFPSGITKFHFLFKNKRRNIMNTKITKSLVWIILNLFVLNACVSQRVISGSGNLAAKSIPVSGFHHIVLGGVGEVVVHQNGEESLSVETDDNLLQYVRVNVHGDTLHLSLVVPGFETAKPSQLRFTLGVGDLASIDTNGIWTVTSDTLVSDNLQFILTGANKFDISFLTAKELSVRVSGSADIKLSGAVTHQSIKFIGGGTYDAGDLGSETTGFLSEGTSRITVWATRNLNGTLNGGGTVFYYGTPQTAFSQSGTGNIQSLGDK